MHKTNQLLSFIALGFTDLVMLTSCENIIFNQGVNEGVIHYRIDYPAIAKDNYMLELMPKEMKTSFANGEFRSDITAGMGLFRTSIICNDDQEELVHSVKMLNKKYASNLSQSDIIKINPHFNDFKITKTGNTKTVAGYDCKEAIVNFRGDSAWQFRLYYTDQIKIKNPNRHSPFHEIDGVLMEYEMINYQTHMRFIAEKVEEIEVEASSLKLEDDYEIVSADKLNGELEAIFAKVK
ncbi:MAG: DUF4412 domain-containing protein [Vicingaceae bacterium]